MKDITKEEFIKSYIPNKEEELFETEILLAMKCKCTKRKCKGWTAVINEPYFIEKQLELNASQ